MRAEITTYKIDNPGSTVLPSALRRPSQLPHSARSRYYVACVGMIDKINCQRLDGIGSDQLGSLGLELRQLEYRDLRRLIYQ